MEYELVPLHQNKRHFEDCTSILNQEWPRSKAAREHSLNKSCDTLPCCLVYRRGDNQEVVGFSQVVSVQGKECACLFESVIIRHDLRGKGLGRKLMEATEHFAQRMGMTTVYLNTLDKQGFYTHLGYTPCQPVVSLGANASRVSDDFLQKLLGSGSASVPHANSPLSHGDHHDNTTAHPPPSSTQTVSTPSPPPVAPPPPPPPPPPPIAPPPPPPVPPPSSSGQTGGGKGAVSRHVLRMDPSAVTWMCKTLH